MEEHPLSPWVVGQLCVAFYESRQEEEEGEFNLYLGAIAVVSLDGYRAKNNQGSLFI